MMQVRSNANIQFLKNLKINFFFSKIIEIFKFSDKDSEI